MTKPPTQKPRPKASLMDDTDQLVHSIVRRAKKRRKLADGTLVLPDIAEQVRAADLALKFLLAKEKIPDSEETQSEFANDLRSYHEDRT